MQTHLLYGPGARYLWGLVACVGIAIYGIWLVVLGLRGDTVGWLRILFPKARILQIVIGILLQVPLLGYLFVGVATGIFTTSAGFK